MEGTPEHTPPVIPPQTDTTEPSTAYPADAPTHEVEVTAENAGQKFVLTHLFAPLTLEHLHAYAKEIVNETQALGKGKERPHFSNEAAEAGLFDRITRGCRVRAAGDKNPAQELTPERAQEFTAEEKAKAIARYKECDVTVNTKAEDTGIGFLFEQEGEMAATLYVGGEDNPSYVVPLIFTRPSNANRTRFRDGFVTQERSRKNGKLRVKSLTDYKTATKFFDDHFVSAENVLIGGEAYGRDQRDQFLSCFNPWFKTEIASEIILSFFKDAQD